MTSIPPSFSALETQDPSLLTLLPEMEQGEEASVISLSPIALPEEQLTDKVVLVCLECLQNTEETPSLFNNLLIKTHDRPIPYILNKSITVIATTPVAKQVCVILARIERPLPNPMELAIGQITKALSLNRAEVRERPTLVRPSVATRESERPSDKKIPKGLEQENVTPVVILQKVIPLIAVLPWYHKENSQQNQGQHKQEWEVQECTSTGSKHKNHIFASDHGGEEHPILEPPRIGIYALYYILTKLGIISDAASHWETKQTIEMNEAELRQLYQERIAQMKKALDYEQSTKLWGMFAKIFSWMASCMSIITGAALMITGVGAVAGALLIAGGLISLTNQILEVTGGWEKIAQKLPTDSPEKRQAMISWMRIGISVLCLILSGAGAMGAGWSAVSEAMGNFMAVFGGVVMIGGGVATVGQGITLYLHKDRLADYTQHGARLTTLRHRREDLMETMDLGIARMKQLFEDMAKILDFEFELFRASQRITEH